MAVNGYFGGDENVLKLIGDDYTTVNILKTNELYALSWVKGTVGGLYLNIAFYLKVGGHGRKWQGWNFHQLQIKNFGKLWNRCCLVFSLTSHIQLSAISVYPKACSHFSPLAPTAWSKPPPLLQTTTPLLRSPFPLPLLSLLCSPQSSQRDPIKAFLSDFPLLLKSLQ